MQSVAQALVLPKPASKPGVFGRFLSEELSLTLVYVEAPLSAEIGADLTSRRRRVDDALG